MKLTQIRRTKPNICKGKSVSNINYILICKGKSVSNINYTLTLLRTYSYTAAAHMRCVLITKTINSCDNLIYTRVATQESTF